MNRQLLLQKLERYQAESPADQEQALRIIDFVENNPNCFDRELLSGHIVGSAWVLNKDKTKVLLTHHLKLDKWVQLGGHSDENPDTLDVAYREAQEESGLKSVIALSPEIFDVDVHPYPARDRKMGDKIVHEPEHFHYDIRFAFTADDQEKIITQEDESKSVQWVALEDIRKFTKEEATLRMIRKTGRL